MSFRDRERERTLWSERNTESERERERRRQREGKRRRERESDLGTIGECWKVRERKAENCSGPLEARGISVCSWIHEGFP